MEAVWESMHRTRGPALLLEHCAVLERLDDARPSARERLRHELGGELAGLLLRALAGEDRRHLREAL